MSWLRRIAGKTRRDRIRNDGIRKELGQTETLVSRMSKRRLTWFGQVVRMEDKRLPAKALYCYVDGKRSTGRQTKTLMENLRQDLAEKDMDLRTALDTIRDRGKCRHLVKTSSSVNTWGPSIYAVHTEGGGVRLRWTHVDGGGGSTLKIKIRVH